MDNELPVVSVSRLKTFIQCPYLYYRRYILKERELKSVHLVLGLAIHETIQYYYDVEFSNINEGMPNFGAVADAPKTRQGNVLAHFKHRWFTLLAENKLPQDERLFSVGTSILTKFDFDKRIPLEQEKKFDIPFPRDNPFFRMYGYIDAIGPDWFIDYKTNTKKPTKKVLDNDPQFIIYYHAFKHLYAIDPTPIWFHLRTGEEMVANVGSRDKLELVLSSIHSMLETDKRGEYPPTPDTCKFCPYNCKRLTKL